MNNTITEKSTLEEAYMEQEKYSVWSQKFEERLSKKYQKDF